MEVNTYRTTTVYTAMTEPGTVMTAQVSAPGASKPTRARSTVMLVATNASMVTGAALVAWSAAIHLDLWHSGYRSITTIGPLFLLQALSGFVLALVIAGSRWVVPALAGVGFLASTLGGLVLSAQVGLFGFKESYDAPFAHLAIVVEIVAIIVLALACVLRIRWTRASSRQAHSER